MPLGAVYHTASALTSNVRIHMPSQHDVRLAFGMNTSALGFMLLTVSGGPASSSGLLVQRGLLASAPQKQF